MMIFGINIKIILPTYAYAGRTYSHKFGAIIGCNKDDWVIAYHKSGLANRHRRSRNDEICA